MALHNLDQYLVGDLLQIGSLHSPLKGDKLSSVTLFHEGIGLESNQFQTILMVGALTSAGRPCLAEALNANQVVGEGKKLLQDVEQRLPHLFSLRYSNADIDSFFQEIGPSKKVEVGKFLHGLVERGQISREQYDRAVRKHELAVQELPVEVKSICELKDAFWAYFPYLKSTGHFLYLSSAFGSCFEEPNFFESIISNSDVEFREIEVDLGKMHTGLKLFHKL